MSEYSIEFDEMKWIYFGLFEKKALNKTNIHQVWINRIWWWYVCFFSRIFNSQKKNWKKAEKHKVCLFVCFFLVSVNWKRNVFFQFYFKVILRHFNTDIKTRKQKNKNQNQKKITLKNFLLFLIKLNHRLMLSFLYQGQKSQITQVI